MVEILSSDWARDIIRKAAKYAAAGVERYWIIDPDGPQVIVCRLVDSVLAEQARHGPGTAVTLDVGPGEVTFDPAAVLEQHPDPRSGEGPRWRRSGDPGPDSVAVS